MDLTYVNNDIYSCGWTDSCLPWTNIAIGCYVQISQPNSFMFAMLIGSWEGWGEGVGGRSRGGKALTHTCVILQTSLHGNTSSLIHTVDYCRHHYLERSVV